jgi:hypothetical protein
LGGFCHLTNQKHTSENKESVRWDTGSHKEDDERKQEEGKQAQEKDTQEKQSNESKSQESKSSPGDKGK